MTYYLFRSENKKESVSHFKWTFHLLSNNSKNYISDQMADIILSIIFPASVLCCSVDSGTVETTFKLFLQAYS